MYFTLKREIQILKNNKLYILNISKVRTFIACIIKRQPI